MAARTGRLLQELFQTLLEAFGPQDWWPGETPFEVALGAILTQNTNWNNVARVIAGLKAAGLLEPGALKELPEGELARLLRPAGYYNVKARRLKNFLAFLGQFEDSMTLMAEAELNSLRPALLGVKGIGPETADSILLYALDKPMLVIDEYPRRLVRKQRLSRNFNYGHLQKLFMNNLPRNYKLYQDFHALIVIDQKIKWKK